MVGFYANSPHRLFNLWTKGDQTYFCVCNASVWIENGLENNASSMAAVNRKLCSVVEALSSPLEALGVHDIRHRGKL